MVHKFICCQAYAFLANGKNSASPLVATLRLGANAVVHLQAFAFQLSAIGEGHNFITAVVIAINGRGLGQMICRA